MPEFEYRDIRSEEIPSYVQTMFKAAGRPVDPDFIEKQVQTLDLENAIAAFDGKDLVGTIGARNLEITLPSLESVSLSAIGQAGVLPTHTRKGIMRELMMRSLRAAEERGDPLAGWTTSEWPIYERYGGVATFSAAYRIRNAQQCQLRPNNSSNSDAKLQLINADEALSIIPSLHKRTCQRPGGVPRTTRYWERLITRLQEGKSPNVLEYQQDLPPPLFCLAVDEGGSIEGACIYRIHPQWEDGSSRSMLEVISFLSTTPSSAKALWGHIFETDLIEDVCINHAPVELPLRYMLKDGRKVKTKSVIDHLWLRAMKPVELLETIDLCGVCSELTLSVKDRVGLTDEKLIRITNDGVDKCKSTTTSCPNISMSIGIFSSLIIGGTSIWEYALSNRIDYDSKRSLRLFSSVLESNRPPFTDTYF